MVQWEDAKLISRSNKVRKGHFKVIVIFRHCILQYTDHNSYLQIQLETKMLPFNTIMKYCIIMLSFIDVTIFVKRQQRQDESNLQIHLHLFYSFSLKGAHNSIYRIIVTQSNTDTHSDIFTHLHKHTHTHTHTFTHTHTRNKTHMHTKINE